MENKNTHLMYGFLTGIVMIVLTVGLYVSGLSFVKGMQFVAYSPLLIGCILNAMAFSKSKDGYVTFGNVFGSCFKVTMIVTILLVAWNLLTPYIFPDMKEKMLNRMHEEMVKRQNWSDEQLEMSINMFRKYWNIIMISSILFTTLAFGAIFSLIASAIAKKKGVVPITSDNF